MKILDAVQECSGLELIVRPDGEVLCPDCDGEGYDCWWCAGTGKVGLPSKLVRPPVPGLSVEEAERLIEEQGVEVQGRL